MSKEKNEEKNFLMVKRNRARGKTEHYFSLKLIDKIY